jgi:hypothetical protein
MGTIILEKDLQKPRTIKVNKKDWQMITWTKNKMPRKYRSYGNFYAFLCTLYLAQFQTKE